TRGLALAAEQAAAEVERELAVAGGDRLRGAGVDAGAAAVRACAACDDGQPAVALGQRRVGRRERRGAEALADARAQEVEHRRRPLQVVSRVGQVEALVAEREVRNLLPAQ